MAITAATIGANDNIVFRKVQGARFPAWVWRELHTVRTVAGDNRSGALIVDDGAEQIMVLSKDDYDMLLTAIRSENEEPKGEDA